MKKQGLQKKIETSKTKVQAPKIQVSSSRSSYSSSPVKKQSIVTGTVKKKTKEAQQDLKDDAYAENEIFNAGQGAEDGASRFATGQFGGVTDRSGLSKSGEINQIVQFTPGHIESLRIGFVSVDKNGDGLISRAEMKILLKTVQDGVTDQLINELFEQADQDKDGLIAFEELSRVCSKNKLKTLSDIQEDLQSPVPGKKKQLNTSVDSGSKLKSQIGKGLTKDPFAVKVNIDMTLEDNRKTIKPYTRKKRSERTNSQPILLQKNQSEHSQDNADYKNQYSQYMSRTKGQVNTTQDSVRLAQKRALSKKGQFDQNSNQFEIGDPRNGISQLKQGIETELYQTDGVIDLDTKAKVDLLDNEKAKLDKQLADLQKKKSNVKSNELWIRAASEYALNPAGFGTRKTVLSKEQEKAEKDYIEERFMSSPEIRQMEENSIMNQFHQTQEITPERIKAPKQEPFPEQFGESQLQNISRLPNADQSVISRTSLSADPVNRKSGKINTIPLRGTPAYYEYLQGLEEQNNQMPDYIENMDFPAAQKIMQTYEGVQPIIENMAEASPLTVTKDKNSSRIEKSANMSMRSHMTTTRTEQLAQAYSHRKIIEMEARLKVLERNNEKAGRVMMKKDLEEELKTVKAQSNNLERASRVNKARMIKNTLEQRAHDKAFNQRVQNYIAKETTNKILLDQKLQQKEEASEKHAQLQVKNAIQKERHLQENLEKANKIKFEKQQLQQLNVERQAERDRELSNQKAQQLKERYDRANKAMLLEQMLNEKKGLGSEIDTQSQFLMTHQSVNFHVNERANNNKSQRLAESQFQNTQQLPGSITRLAQRAQINLQSATESSVFEGPKSDRPGWNSSKVGASFNNRFKNSQSVDNNKSQMIKPSRKLKNDQTNANRKSAMDAKLDHQKYWKQNSLDQSGSASNSPPRGKHKLNQSDSITKIASPPREQPKINTKPSKSSLNRRTELEQVNELPIDKQRASHASLQSKGSKKSADKNNRYSRASMNRTQSAQSFNNKNTKSRSNLNAQKSETMFEAVQDNSKSKRTLLPVQSESQFDNYMVEMPRRQSNSSLAGNLGRQANYLKNLSKVKLSRDRSLDQSNSTNQVYQSQDLGKTPCSNNNQSQLITKTSKVSLQKQTVEDQRKSVDRLQQYTKSLENRQNPVQVYQKSKEPHLDKIRSRYSKSPSGINKPKIDAKLPTQMSSEREKEQNQPDSSMLRKPQFINQKEADEPILESAPSMPQLHPSDDQMIQPSQSRVQTVIDSTVIESLDNRKSQENIDKLQEFLLNQNDDGMHNEEAQIQSARKPFNVDEQELNILDTVGDDKEKLLLNFNKNNIDTELDEIANQEVTTPAEKPQSIIQEEASHSKTENRDRSMVEEDGKSQASGASSKMLQILQQKKERLERQANQNTEREALAAERQKQRQLRDQIPQDDIRVINEEIAHNEDTQNSRTNLLDRDLYFSKDHQPQVIDAEQSKQTLIEVQVEHTEQQRNDGTRSVPVLQNQLQNNPSMALSSVQKQSVDFEVIEEEKTNETIPAAVQHATGIDTGTTFDNRTQNEPTIHHETPTNKTKNSNDILVASSKNLDRIQVEVKEEKKVQKQEKPAPVNHKRITTKGKTSMVSQRSPPKKIVAPPQLTDAQKKKTTVIKTKK